MTTATMIQKQVVIPNIEWYLDRSKTNGLSPRCPFATVESCPRFYQSLSLLGEAGSTKISEKHNKKLLKKWKKSPLWPVTEEQATSISGPEDGYKHFSKFCPEVSYERFGYFASGLYRYADEIDRENVHRKLPQLNVHQNDWRWYWANIDALHYSECPYYSLLLDSKSVAEKTREDIVEIKPSVWGIGLNLNAAFRKLKEWIMR
jgi:hypothetical protein